MAIGLFILYIFLNLGLAWFFDRQARRALTHSPEIQESQSLPPITLIKPLKGVDEFSEENFLSWLTQIYPNEIQFIFSLQDPRDPALRLLQRLKQKHSFEILINPVRPGFTGKMSNLFYGIERAHHEVLVFSDGDIFAPPETLRKTLSLLTENVGIVSCLPKHTDSKNLWGHMYAATWNNALFTYWAPLMVSGKAQGVAGGTIALRQQTLQAMGGIEKFGNILAEDLAMGKAARALGLQLALGPAIISRVGKICVRPLIDKLMRAHLIGIYMNQHGLPHTFIIYFLSFAYIPVFFYALFAGKWMLLGLCLFYIVARSFFLGRMFRYASGRFRYPYEYFLGGIFSLGTFLVSLFNRRVTWGEIEFQVDRGGLLKSVRKAPSNCGS